VFAPQPSQQQPVFAPQPVQAASPQYAPAQPPQPAPTPLMDNPSTWTPQAQQQQAQQPVYYIDNNNKKKMPPWLAGILVVLVMGGGFYALYKFVGGKNGSSPAAVKTETSGEAAIAGHPYTKHIELAALRLIEEGKKTKLRFTVVNHSAADLPGVGIRVTLTTTKATADEPPLSVFDAKAGDIPAYGTKDIEVEIKTEKRVYELPDWQFLKVSFEITAPK
jgi:hypothetical protein